MKLQGSAHLLNHNIQMLYNDQSPMENHHVAASFAVLTDPRNNFLDGLSRKVSEGRGYKLS